MERTIERDAACVRKAGRKRRLVGKILALLAGICLMGALGGCEVYVHDHDHHHWHDHDHDHHDHDWHDHDHH